MENLDNFFEDIFALFALGVRKKSTKSMAYLLWVINLAIPLSVIFIHLSEESLTTSYDALSKITDIVQLLGPIFIHLIVITIFLSNHDLYSKIHEARENLENLLKIYHKEEIKRKIQVKKILIFTFKVFLVEGIGLAIDAFLIIT